MREIVVRALLDHFVHCTCWWKISQSYAKEHCVHVAYVALQSPT